MPVTEDPEDHQLVPGGRRGDLRVIIGLRHFRRLVGVRLVSQFGDGLFQAALAGSLLFNPGQATSPTAIATGFAVLLLPYSLIGPYVGVFLDRWSRRSVLFTANLVRAALVLPAALLIWYGRESVPYALCALLIIGINRFFLSGLSAAAPHVVPQQRLVTANAVATTLGTLTYSLGLGVAAALFTVAMHKNVHGYATLAALAAAGYSGSALLARISYTRGQLGPDDAQHHHDPIGAAVREVTRGMVAGVRHLVARRAAAYAMLAQSVHRALYGVLTLATLLLYRRYFYGDDDGKALAGLAQVVIAGGFGSLLAAFVTPPVTRRLGGWRWIATLLGGVGVLVLVLGLPFRAPLLVAATFFVNVASQGTKIVVDTTLQRECVDDYRGRVFSVNDTTFNFCYVVGLFIAAAALPANGRSVVAILAVAAAYLVLSGWYAVAARSAARAAQETPVPARSTASG